MLENPFPGMNPYLENPRSWQGIHHRIISAIDSELSAVLPEEYGTFIEERVYVEGWDKQYRPDGIVVQTAPTNSGRNGGSIGVMERTETSAAVLDAPLTLEWTPRTAHEPFIEIRSLNETEELIAVIEVLSLTNKEPGPGRDEYQRKQRAVFNSMVHLLEIDLLRTGQRSVPPDEAGRFVETPPCDYLISLHRGGQGAIVDVWPVLLPQRLPIVGLPLAYDGTLVPFDLQAVVNRACSEGGLAKNLLRFYRLPPNPPLNKKDAEWADTLLRERGLRP